MRLGCLLPLISVVLVVGGAQGFYTVFSNRKPVEVSIQDFLKQVPDAKWIKVTGGQLDTIHAVYNAGITQKSEAREIYVPVVAPGSDSSSEPIKLLLLTKDPQLVKFINDGNKLDESLSEEQALEFMLKNVDKLRPARDVQGLVQFGIDSNDKRRRKIADLYKNLADDAVILEDGKKPDIAQASFFLFGGLALGGVLALRSFKKSSPPPLPPAASPQTGGSSGS
ncbi:hypothetical protein [Luteolibacter luteus]|uniref:Uncharacterized protein n=1 Tax=Luteolibacter luteus TaxID=2728835 RepID=A0A858RMI0_9BACT|nr:hypothetical protein [Luteolibacter luteus]QJE97801.1 hypothetical protein HHL09_19110 [Luteolibacter luteus]